MPWAMRSPNGLPRRPRGSQCCGCQSPVSAQKPITSASPTVREAVRKRSPADSRSNGSDQRDRVLARVCSCLLPVRHGSHLLQGDVGCAVCARARHPDSGQSTPRSARASRSVRSPRRRSPSALARLDAQMLGGVGAREPARVCAAGSSAAAISRRLTIADRLLGAHHAELGVAATRTRWSAPSALEFIAMNAPPKALRSITVTLGTVASANACTSFAPWRITAVPLLA